MKFIFAVVLVSLLLGTRNAYALGTVEDKGSRVNTHVPSDRALRNPCIAQDSNTPTITYYFDGDGTPDAVAYSDYLEDLAHWYTLTPDACVPVPVADPTK